MNYHACGGMRYVICQGDTLYRISRMYRIPLADLMRANPYVDVYHLQVGDEICIPMMPSNPGPGGTPMPNPNPMPMPGPGPGPVRPQRPGMPGGMPQWPGNSMMPGRPGMPDDGHYHYVVQPGDTMESVLNKLGMDLEEFIKHNPLSLIMLQPGSTVKRPIEDRSSTETEAEIDK